MSIGSAFYPARYNTQVGNMKSDNFTGINRRQIARYFGNDKAVDTLIDSSGFGRDGTFTGGIKEVIPKMGRSLSIVGALNEYVDLGTSTEFQALAEEPFSVSMWIKPIPSGIDTILLGNVYTGATTSGFTIRKKNSNKIRFILVTNSGNFHYSDMNTTLSGRPQHILCVWDGISPRTYLDGVEDTNTTLNGTLTTLTSTKSLRIGNVSGHAVYYTGSMCDLRIWKRVLTRNEARMLYLERMNGIVSDYAVRGSDAVLGAYPLVNGGLVNNGLVNAGLAR